MSTTPTKESDFAKESYSTAHLMTNKTFLAAESAFHRESSELATVRSPAPDKAVFRFTAAVMAAVDTERGREHSTLECQ